MKKLITIFIFVFGMFIFTDGVNAESINVKLKNCIDGDTAMFTYNGKDIKARFLAVDTPETKHSSKGEQPYGEEASNYTCKRLENAKKIVLEYDPASDKEDLYDRHLVWVWLDGKLLQKDLISNGYAKVAYLYAKYKYVDELNKLEEKAKEKKLRVWSDTTDYNYVDNSDESETDDYIDSIFSKLHLYEIFTGSVIVVVALLLKKIYKKN
jgi:micrococcal nuclease